MTPLMRTSYLDAPLCNFLCIAPSSESPHFFHTNLICYKFSDNIFCESYILTQFTLTLHNLKVWRRRHRRRPFKRQGRPLWQEGQRGLRQHGGRHHRGRPEGPEGQGRVQGGRAQGRLRAQVGVQGCCSVVSWVLTGGANSQAQL